MKIEYKKIEQKMKKAMQNRWSRPHERVRCPSLKKMAEYINNTMKGYTARVDTTSCYKGRQLPSGVFYSQQTYHGNRVIVKKGNKIVLDHDATGTYRHNTEVAEWIFQEIK